MTIRLLTALLAVLILQSPTMAERGFLTCNSYTGFMDRNIRRTVFQVDAPNISQVNIQRLGARTVKGKGVLVMAGRKIKRGWIKHVVVGPRYGLVAQSYAPVPKGGK